MTVGDFLASAQRRLLPAGISTGRLDTLVLLEDATGKDRAWLLAHPETELDSQTLRRLDEQIEQRSQHVPLAYIRGKTEFYGREFIVNSSVLEPRPESETIIDLLETLGLPKSSAVIDVGTGSGALAITAKLELPNMHVTAIDIDQKCLEVARQNAEKHHVDISFLQGDLLEPLQDTKYPAPHTTLLCNLPYVPEHFHINTAALHEPRLAIFGGIDGLDLYRQLFSQISSGKLTPHYILTESLPIQHKALAHLARKHNYALIQTDDFIQVFEAM